MFGRAAAADRIFVKICGITNEADAVAAIESGADALGLNLVAESKRYIDITIAAEWIGKLPRAICKVAIMVNPSREEALRVSQLPFIDALQLHGRESPEFCQDLSEVGIRFAKAVPVVGPDSLLDLPNYYTDMLVLDSAARGLFGGTGQTFPWKFGREFVRLYPRFNVILAGGLTAGNVAEAVRVVGPRGVDVTSGVELTAGRKDHRLVKAFIEAARGVGRLA